MDMKNRCVDFSSNRNLIQADASKILLKEKRFTQLNKSLPFSLNDEDEDGLNGHDEVGADSSNIETHTVHTIEDVTGRLSNLVRLMDENSKLMQPSDLTIKSYESQSVSEDETAARSVFIIHDNHDDLAKVSTIE